MKKTNTNTILAGGLALAVFGAWSLGDYINGNLELLPVDRVPTNQTAVIAQPFDVKNLFPVWVASSTKTQDQSGESGSVDDLFASTKPVAPPMEAVVADMAPPVQKTDYAAVLASHMRLESLAVNGGFINGKFYRVGEDIADFEYPSGNRQVIPRLVEVRARSVIVAHGGKRTEIVL